ncbi:anthranilate phosphoribosyltransferase [Nakamurella panacisegetis]|uniref:Anthranilate phosphoribosyltransferase n=1 Tax=Nakamurella panacisegetis TaxID=1090615 RepID=A0A1H0R1U2_9ACTN|nr:anthranilate phosphoribosyltransferase [Nakamurella panacisegetis]SDP23512.1 anthranilate phosphoribosyltransferase [Nakamurella panacisegetis]
MGSAQAADFTWPEILGALLAGRDLASDRTEWAMDRIMNGEATPAQIAAFAVALRAKGETASEIAGLADSMLSHCVPVHVPGRTVDIVGTGGDRSNTVNISTMSAIVTAAAGATVVKHGGRAASSKCGAADLLEGLGVPIMLGPDGVAATVARAGIGFCFAQVFHPSMRFAGPTRRELGVPTFFNVLGPLSNPARPAASAIGCGNPAMAPVIAGVFAARGAEVLVFRGDDGLDELTTTTTSTVWVVRDGTVGTAVVDPARLGVRPAAPEDLVGGDVAFNTAVARRLFDGERGAVHDAVVLNSAAAIAVHTGLSGDLEADLAAGLVRATDALESGAAAALLARWVQVGAELSAGA